MPSRIWDSRHAAVVVATLLVVAVLPGTTVAQEIDQTVQVVSDAWNSLEVVKLAIALLTPAAMLGIGLWMDRRIKEFEHRQWSNQKVIEKRLEVYEKITPQLNELMCYFVRVGSWKEHAPTAIIDMKRDLDKIAHVYAPLFSPNFIKRYNDFMELCFATFRGAGKDAQLRAVCEPFGHSYVGEDNDDGTWQPEWNDCFTGAEEASDPKEVRAAYQSLVSLIARELGVGLESVNDNAAA